jgi:hypothetical protein
VTWADGVRGRLRALVDRWNHALSVPRPPRGQPNQEKEPTMAEKRFEGFGSTAKEVNNQKEGRTGSGTPTKDGPAVPGSGIKKNPTMDGGINRATKGKKD